MDTASSSMSRDPESLDDIVLDYVTTHAFASTAKILSRPRRSAPRAAETTTHNGTEESVEDNGDGSMDVDHELGDSTESARKAAKRPMYGERLVDSVSLESVERRRNILNHILNGAIMRAVEALETHFPAVLAEPAEIATNGNSKLHLTSGTYSNGSDTPFHPPWSSYSLSAIPPPLPDHAMPVFPKSTHPSHVRLNLQIQQFIESFRQLGPSSPSSPSSSISSLTSSMHMSTSLHHNGTSSSGATLTNALTAAQGLHSEAKKLPAEARAVYLQEIKDVGALFAYTNPETSILKGFLEQGRRIALAEQVNRAVLRSEGRPVESLLETIARRTDAVYSLLLQHAIDPRPGPDEESSKEAEWISNYFRRRGPGITFRTRELVDRPLL
ncbi:CTLH/CRA C-terminal to lish motif domain-domain-containing protein [Naematelia encephala]|uniref:CTLH/CRA C-terminal to lish motif domain-domain-containing protein n=1 Tax=Naematelia encephala TaxID=71784 RepID=A0A1Y2BGP5_9TREE|nr:CTLH/CRA C-terminal to lish motif domain-domain-containing protein [Naematelia encephala]